MKPRLLFSVNSFHIQKTKSSLFFKDLLERRYEVTLVPHKDLFAALGTRRYEVLVVWQHAFSPRILEATQIPQVAYVPMYDDLPPPSYWDRLAERGVGVVSFCGALSALVRKSGLPLLEVRYYPTPQPEAARFDRGLRVFFWQRVAFISPQVVLTWTKGWDVRGWHFHECAPPPGLGKSEVRCTSWFDSRQAYQEALGACNVFVAPRSKEGIGMAFLEAMARGMLVLAWDAPTMNEYMQNGRNGLLTRGFQPLPIPSHPQTLGQAALEAVREGRRRWEDGQEEILDFLAALPRVVRRATPIRWRETGLLRLRVGVRRVKSLFRRGS